MPVRCLRDDEEGMRGSGSQAFAAQIWGMTGSQYLQAADPWPLNPKGEIMISLKIEDKYALANAEKTAAVPGVAYAEWGPGDMGMSLGFLDNHDPPYPPAMAAVGTQPSGRGQFARWATRRPKVSPTIVPHSRHTSSASGCSQTAP